MSIYISVVQNVQGGTMKAILTPRQFADGIGVSESSVKRWVDDGRIVATRTEGGHRRISIQEAARYIREHGTVVVRPDVLGLADVVEATAAAPDGVGEQLFHYLRTGAAAEARGFLVSRYLEGSSVAEIIDGPLGYAMTKIGEAWVSNPSGIFWEHRATQIAIQAIDRLRLLMSAREDAPVAVGGAPTGDPYILPSLAAAAVLEGEGVAATNLGPETPLSTLGRASADLDAQLVWLSVSVVADVKKLRREIERLSAELADRGALLVVGGARAPSLGLSKRAALYVGGSMAELEALVQGMTLSLAGRGEG
jgi:excisionase family DNA binding protein